MTTVITDEDDEEKWKENMSRRMRRIKILLGIIGIQIIVLIVEVWVFQHNAATVSSSALRELEEALSSLNDIEDAIAILHEIQYAMNHESESDVAKSVEKKIEEIKKSLKQRSPLYSEGKSIEFIKTNNVDVDVPLSHEIGPDGLAPSCNGTIFQLELLLDDYADETSWELTNSQGDIVVSSPSYGDKDSWEKKVHATCLQPGPYVFSIFDSNKDGIRCSDKSGCYSISLDNELIIQGSTFDKEIVVHSFDSSSFCIVGSIFILEIQFDYDDLDIDWQLLDSISGKVIKLDLVTDRNEKINKSFVSCLSPGIYTFAIVDTSMKTASDTKASECYRILIDNKPLIYSFTPGSTHTFYILNDRSVHEELCQKLPNLSRTIHHHDFLYNKRVEEVLNVISSLSSIESLEDHGSHQYKAACWMLFVDTHETSTKSELLVERYAFAVFLHAINLDVEVLMSIDTCDYNKRKISCNKEGYITKIDMRFTDIQGTIPSELSHLRHLDYLDLGANRLVGTLPPELGMLSNLKELSLDDNDLTGKIPIKIDQLKDLGCIRLNNNKLSGQIPTEIGTLRLLEELYLDNNELTGPLPEDIKNLNISVFFINDNFLTGTLPDIFGNFTISKKLDFSNNTFSGPIPSSLWRLIDLWEFRFRRNDLETKISYDSSPRVNNISINDSAIFSNEITDQCIAKDTTRPGKSCLSKNIYNLKFYKGYWIDNRVAYVTFTNNVGACHVTD